MKLLITGGKGMLGRTLCRRLAAHEICVADLPDVDITDATSIGVACQQFRPDVVIHCAAMTNVDGCEANRAAAFRVNALGSENVARAAEAVGARVIGISTDYVFDGQLDRPYREDDEPKPKTVYGASKLAGERAIAQYASRYTIIRIAWLYGRGGPSFVHTMLALGAQDGAPLKVVNDQIGNPTSTDAVATLIEQLLERPLDGVVHGSCEGEATWYDFTRTIFELAGLSRDVLSCTTREFSRPAPRPSNSRLEKARLHANSMLMPEWRDALKQFLAGPRE